MTIEPGMKLYRYTVRNGKFYIHEGTVNDNGIRKVVNFTDCASKHRCPRIEDIGVVRNAGPSLWLIDRDDELAKQIFLDYEEYKLAQLRRLIDKKIEIIRMLREGDE